MSIRTGHGTVSVSNLPGEEEEDGSEYGLDSGEIETTENWVYITTTDGMRLSYPTHRVLEIVWHGPLG